MPITLSVSTLFQSRTQSRRLTSLGREMDNLQRQVTTSKRYDTYTGFGTEAYTLQSLKARTPKIESYMKNIDKAGTDMEQMISLMEQVSEISNEIKGAINLRTNDKQGIEDLAAFAKSNLEFLEDLINEQGIDGSYLFAGSNTADAVFINDSALKSNYKNEVDNWLNGTNTNAQLQANSEAFTSVNLGFSNKLDTAGGRNIQIDNSLTVDFSVKGNIDGMQNIIRAMTLVASMEFPGPADVATENQMNDMFLYASNVLSQGSLETNNETEQLSSKFSFIKSIEKNHQNDLTLYEEQIDEIENINPSEALLKMQLLQTQLETSYQITSILSELSLVNYMR